MGEIRHHATLLLDACRSPTDEGKFGRLLLLCWPPNQSPRTGQYAWGLGQWDGGLLKLQGSRESVMCRGHHVWVSGKKNCLPPFRSAWSSPSGEVKLLNVHTHPQSSQMRAGAEKTSISLCLSTDSGGVAGGGSTEMGASGFQTGVKRGGQGPGVTVGASQGLSGLGSRHPFPHSLTLEHQLLVVRCNQRPELS